MRVMIDPVTTSTMGNRTTTAQLSERLSFENSAARAFISGLLAVERAGEQGEDRGRDDREADDAEVGRREAGQLAVDVTCGSRERVVAPRRQVCDPRRHGRRDERDDGAEQPEADAHELVLDPCG